MTDASVNPPDDGDAVITQKQSDWLTTLTGLEVTSKAARTRIDNHLDALKMIETDLDRTKLKQAMTYELTKVPDGLWEKFKDKLGVLDKIKSIDPDGDPMKEIDSWHHLPGTESLGADKIDQILGNFSKIVQMRDKLEKMPAYQKTDPETGETVTDDLKIAEDLWQPLVREGIIPENAVPDRYSEVARTFKGATEAYDARLVEYSEGLSDSQKLLDKFKPAFSVGEGLLKMGSGAASMSANIQVIKEGGETIQASEKARDIDKVRSGIDLTLLCVVSTRTMAEQAVEAKDVHGVIDAFNAMLKGVLTASVGSSTAGLVSTIITCTSRTAKFGDKLAQGDIEGALQAIGDAVEAGIAQDNSDNKQMAGHIKGGIYMLGAVAKGAQDGDPRAGVASAVGAVKIHANAVGSAILSDKLDEKVAALESDTSLSETEREAQITYLKANTSTSPSGLDDVSGGIQSGIKMKTLDQMIAADFDQEKVDAQREEFEQAQAQAMLDFAATPDPKFENLLLNGFSDLPSDAADTPEAEQRKLEDQANSIEMLIAICKRDQQTYELAKSIATGGPKFVASFLPAAGIVVVGMELMYALIEANKHTEQLLLWSESLGDAKSAKTVQADAILNRYGLQKTQTIRADMLAALKAIDFVGQVVKTAGGPAAPVGLAISAGTKIAEGAMDVALTVKTEVEMAQAWSIYKKALRTPQDRYLARQALQQNPTLSKYAMAYGALKEKNPVAIKAMARCGLSEVTLAHEGTNMNKVVEYLETIYKDDPKLLKSVIDAEAWHPGKPELSVISWSTFYTNATTSKDIKPKVKSVDVSSITAAMGRYEEARGACARFFDEGYNPVEADDPAELATIAMLADTLVAEFGRFNPVDEDGNAHEGMADYVDAMEALAETVVDQIATIRGEINAAREQAATLREMDEAASKHGTFDEDDLMEALSKSAELDDEDQSALEAAKKDLGKQDDASGGETQKKPEPETT